jgi:transposase-like protein
MKLITTEVVDTGEKKDGQGRRLIRAQERTALLAAYEQSGLTQKAFAQREGIKFSTFTAWLLRYRQQGAAAAKPAFTEVRLAEARPSWPVEIALPNGIVIRAQAPERVVELVGALRSC